MQPPHKECHVVSEFRVRCLTAGAKGAVIVCISAEENLFDEKASRFLQDGMWMGGKCGSFSQGFNVTGRNL